MDAVVMAGGIPNPEDPLYTFLKGDAKALVDVAGKPMIQWVLDALSGAKRVDNVILVGLSPKNQLTCRKPLHFVSNQGRMLPNIVAGVKKSLELDPDNQYVLLVSSDIPALKPDMVDWLVDACTETEDDLYYGICPRAVMEARFPGSRRTYTKLKGVELCGADINMIHVRMALEPGPKLLKLWEALIGSRKNAFRQATMFGWDTFFQVATRSITLEDLVEKVCRRMGVKGRVIVWDQAEPCMDVDKPHQLELLRMDLAKKQRGPSARTRAAVKKPAKKPAQSKSAPKTVRKGAGSAKKPSTAASATKLKAGK